MRALLTPEIAPRMGVVLFRPGSELMPLFMQGRVLLEPEPEQFSSFASGCDDNPWTTAEFIVWLESQGAFNHPYWMCRGSWSYAYNKIITDTGCGNICLAGAVIEVMGVRGAMTIRVTTSHSVSGW
ncbi:side tail fiber protein [Salmonella enterica subsp. enterica serovar Typhimurium str. DT104]|nr:side tail fiber protein [Salmonella enterica subsp. enterica serovar Typhimurium str. DT104]